MEKLSALGVRNIHKSFPGVKALNDVSFRLNKGEIHALVGENGAGKSTLMNVIMGLLQPDSGEIYLDEKKVVIDSPQKALSLGIGIVPQELNLVPQCSVAENIFLGMEKLKCGLPLIDWDTIYYDAKNILQKIGVNIDVKAKVCNMSVAYQQLVQIARALAFGANILILDEPTACLTSQETEHLFEILNQFKKEGKSIIFISHHMEEIKKMSDKVSVMRDGNLIATMNMSDTNIDEIIKLMVGRDMEQKETSRRKSSAGSCILRVESLGRKNEFQEISFSLKEGEILGIAGLVGAGRTEIVRAIFGATQPDTGCIYWKEKKVSISSPHQAIKLGMGYVPEERRKYGIFPLTSVSQNISMPILKRLVKWMSINHAAEKELTSRYIKELNIKTPSADKQIRLLSGGNQQKTILARWLAKGVKLLILDEPTRGIDVNAKGEIHELIRRLADKGLAVILISSELEEVIQLSDRIMVMHEGSAKGFLDSAYVTQEEILKVALG